MSPLDARPPTDRPTEAARPASTDRPGSTARPVDAGPKGWTATVNGIAVELPAPPDRRLIDILRDDLGLIGAKEACSVGRCGACLVLVDGRPRVSCLTLAYQAAGAEILTVEGLGTADNLHPVQAAFVEEGAFQCGYCTAGMVLATVAALDTDPTADSAALETALVGNLCRCTGYTGIRRALARLTAERDGRTADPEPPCDPPTPAGALEP